MFLTIDEHGSKSLETLFSINICRQLGDIICIKKNSVSNNLRSTFVDSINVFDCRLFVVYTHTCSYKLIVDSKSYSAICIISRKSDTKDIGLSLSR